jgi:hypothetical protein
MRVIRPYGESKTEFDAGANKRVLYDKTPQRSRHEIKQFARAHQELIIAQWISTIDKIATKPNGMTKPTQEQRNFRDALGKACWKKIIEEKRLGSPGHERMAFLEKLWNFKIHPYGALVAKPGNAESERAPRVPSAAGRWFKAFAGSMTVANVNTEEMACRIALHLYDAAFKIFPGHSAQREGKIEARAKSIERNALENREVKAEWSESHEHEYAKAGDVAEQIYKAACQREDKGRRMSLDIAAPALYAHWGRLFLDQTTGKVMPISEARAKRPELFALHMAVKDAYSRKLKHHRKKKMSGILPKNVDGLFRLIQAQRKNQDLAALVRLGRIIHYSASAASQDQTANVVSNWPNDVTQSHYWTSDGQAEIKRAEAFVRVWRHVLAYGSLTLRDWASGMKPFGEDILGSKQAARTAASSEYFDHKHFQQKLELLFGNRAQLAPFQNDNARMAFLETVIDGLRQLRNTSFHFKGRGAFIAELESLGVFPNADVLIFAHSLWKADSGGRTARLKATLKAAHIEYYCDETKGRRLLDLLATANEAEMPLPRFRRVLLRADNAWREGSTRSKLPPPANRSALEAPARLCQYTVLKLLYEKPFRRWLRDVSASTLNLWIDISVDRATRAARNLNAKGDATAREVIVARAASLPKPSPDDDIRTFFFDLSSATASEMRVQRGYESDGEKAREQAGYIDDLLCDVMTHAFEQYLVELKLQWVLDLEASRPMPSEFIFSIDDIPTEQTKSTAQHWQVMLYVLLHLVPVDEAALLMHQLAKWEITAGRKVAVAEEERNRLQALGAVCRLYIDMHDAKFEGSASLTGCDAFKAFFQSPAGFEKVFSKQLAPEDEHTVPRRGLREIIRFGHLPLLKRLAAGNTIMDADIDRVLAAEAAAPSDASEIARCQGQREKLHERWVQLKKSEFPPQDFADYASALSQVISHRRAAAHVRFTNYVHLHRVAMATLARVADYAGLFERDLYFVTLALMHRQGVGPNDIFTLRGVTLLQNGRILDAHLNVKPSSTSNAVQSEIKANFGDILKHGKTRNRRNDFAHFNMLRAGNLATLNLTECVNEARQMMAYDRKLKNAVSLSIKELLARHSVEICWSMSGGGQPHQLCRARIASRVILHLGRDNMREALHGDQFLDMIARLFGGVADPIADVSTVDLTNFDWTARKKHARAYANRKK